eukprot:gene13038-17474_t
MNYFQSNNNNPYYAPQQQSFNGGGNAPPQGGIYGNNNSNNNPNTSGNEDFFRNVSPEMVNYGLTAGASIIKAQQDRFMPGVSGFWIGLKLYFVVSNSYVLKKLQYLLYPMSNKVWFRIPADDFARGDESEVSSRKWALPKQDPNAPDLYIPLMSFVTYVLLYGLCKGLGLGSSIIFTPELLIQAVWRCLLIQIIESGLIKLGVNSMNINISFLDIFSYTGYKYVGLCLNTISRLLGRSINFIVILYTAFMLGFFVLKTMAAVIPPVTNGNTIPPRHLVLLSIAAMQFFVLLLLSWI